MVSCTEWIAAYSELFKFLEKKGGKAAVIRYWEDLADNNSALLNKYASEKGIEGCFEYWTHTLTEEASDFRMEYDPEADVMTTETRSCPSMGLLLKATHIEPYKDYCEHCDVMHRRILDPHGIDFDIDISNCREAKCSSVISWKNKPQDKKN